MSETKLETLGLPKKPAVGQRKRRIPVSGAERNVLTVRNKQPGFEYRFVNVVSDRVQRFMDAGYELVSQDEAGAIGDTRVDTSSGTSHIVEKGVGLGQKAVLMKIPSEFYEEDQKAKQKRVDEIEATMKQEAKRDRYGKIEVSSTKGSE